MDSWGRFNEISSPDKKSFYSELNSEDTTNKDCATREVFEQLKLRKLRDYQGL